ncbi:hypothetical protein RCC94_15315 [Exiguobacterium acetylicum]|nr:hypothetical protein [Exiguobacterium acetylicum]MDQ6468867.1 hypothetical protein [Exiguobacterium acetylicum]
MKLEPLRREIDFDKMEVIAFAFHNMVKQKRQRVATAERDDIYY